MKALGAVGMFPPVKTSCHDHEGSGAVKVQQWDGKWLQAGHAEWVSGDKEMMRKMVERVVAKYAAEKNITPRAAARKARPHHALPCPLDGEGRFHARTSCNRAPAHALPPTYLSVNNIEVIYDHVILVLKGVSLAGARRADRGAAGRQRRRQEHHA